LARGPPLLNLVTPLIGVTSIFSFYICLFSFVDNMIHYIFLGFMYCAHSLCLFGSFILEAAGTSLSPVMCLLLGRFR